MLLACGALCAVTIPSSAQVDPTPPSESSSTRVVHRVRGEGAPLWRATLEARGAAPLDPGGPAPSATSRARLRALVEVEAFLAEARAHAARLDEGAALAVLERARRLAEEHADVPRAARWLAEVELAIGLVATQASRRALADQAFRRAASLDPDRIVRAAEAAPAVAAHARELALGVATSPESLFVVEVDAPNAIVELAGRVVGEAPIEVRAPAGRHVLRVSAPGHRAWGRALDLFEGRRAPVTIHLAPTEAERARRAWVDARTFEEARAALPPATELWWVEARGERALFVRCDAHACSEPQRLVRELPETLPPMETSPSLVSARVWLAQDEPTELPPPPPPRRPWFRRWPVWTGIVLGVAAAAVGIGIAARPEPEQRLRVRIDPGDTAPRGMP